ncbi:MAG TPA: hypothetical protein VIG51_11740 [Candidatus Baltobacteraceae bacterium]|jgi:tetratricopeptide (TPR) repeat protein
MTRARRFLVAALSLLLAATLFRAQLASSLVVRGDEFLYRNDISGAATYYRRAIRIDGDFADAADRLAFLAMQKRTQAALAAAVAATTVYLGQHGDDPRILADRAMCYQIEKRYRKAEPDFERAAWLLRDPRYFTFAGWAAARSGSRTRARKLWVAALRIDPRFLPARHALERRAT